MRVLLIQPPFWAINSPSIGLSSLKAALGGAGIQAEIRYSNLDFAERIGRRDYDAIQAGLPVELLFGDVIFGAALHRDASRSEAARVLIQAMLARPPVVRTIRGGLMTGFRDLCEAAKSFVDLFGEEAPWKGFDLVGFTTTFTLVPALAMAKVMKASCGAPPVVFGGSHCDGPLGMELMQAFHWIDFVARGEGERLIVSLAERLEGGKAGFDAIDGLVWREEGSIKQARVEMSRIPDLDSLPTPDYHDWLRRLEASGWNVPSELRLPIETSRGCWYGDRNRCVFCGLNGLSDRFRSKSGTRILNEYTSLLGYGIPFVNAVDNVIDPEHFKEVIPRIGALATKASLFFEIRPTLTRRQLVALRDAGVSVLQPGIESLSTRLLRLMKKGTTAVQNIRLLRWAGELGLPIFWNMLYGLPGERAEDYDEITELIPSLLHLFPPLSDCNRIHVDRFSPLFTEHQSSIKPNPLYALALGLSSEASRALAYHFDFEGDLAPALDTTHAIERLNEAVQTWHRCVGSAAFISLERGTHRWLFDSRPNAEQNEIELDPQSTQLLRFLDKGTTVERAAERLGAAKAAIQDQLDLWLTHRWIVSCDGVYLGVAASMDAEIPSGIPDAMQGEIAAAIYLHRMQQSWRAAGMAS